MHSLIVTIYKCNLQVCVNTIHILKHIQYPMNMFAHTYTHNSETLFMRVFCVAIAKMKLLHRYECIFVCVSGVSVFVLINVYITLENWVKCGANLKKEDIIGNVCEIWNTITEEKSMIKVFDILREKL